MQMRITVFLVCTELFLNTAVWRKAVLYREEMPIHSTRISPRDVLPHTDNSHYYRGPAAGGHPTSFPGSLFSASLGRWKKDPGCGWSHDHPESGWQKNMLGGRGGRVFCLVDVTNFVGFKSSPSSR